MNSTDPRRGGDAGDVDRPSRRGPLRPPAFQLYAAAHLALTADLTAEELGVVTRLLCHEWLQGPLPDDPQRLARLCQLSPADLKRCWPAIERHFPRDAQAQRAAPWLEEYRGELEEWRSRQAEGGRLGAARRWHRMGHPMGKPSDSDGSPMSNLMGSDGSLSSPSSSSATSPSPKATEGIRGSLRAAAEAEAPNDEQRGEHLMGRHGDDELPR